MVELNQKDRSIKVKLVFYGPPVGGKTTNLKVLHQGAYWGRRGEMISVNSAQDRTILFDFLPLKTSGFRGFDLKLQLVAVPGQSMYAASRKVVLKGTDGVVFVANSALDRWEENLQSFKEMNQYLLAQEIDPNSVPMVLQYNKRDLPQVMDVPTLDRALNVRKLPRFEAVAARGEGVLETFSAILLSTIQDLSRRYRTIELAKGQSPEDWVKETTQGIFGKPSLAFTPGPGFTRDLASFDSVGGAAPAAATKHPPEHRKVRIAMDETSHANPTPETQARVQSALVESYAEASTELGVVASELREERDQLQRRVDQIRRAMDVCDEIAAGKGVVGNLVRAVGYLAEAGNSSYASFLLPAGGGTYRPLVRAPLVEDPMVMTADGIEILASFQNDQKPVVAQASDTPNLGEVFEGRKPVFSAMTVVPIRSSTSDLLGFGMLYYPADAALPSEDALAHLALLARIFRAGLELAVQKGAA
ncbi:MAG TPA: GTPase domain-containing protein [Vicinamibacteria bacterium]